MLVSPEERNVSLGLYFGAYATPASAHEVALYVGDPANGGVELDGTGGYARVTVPNDTSTWPDAPAGGAITSGPVSFPTSSGAWQDSPTHFQLFNADTSDAGDSGLLSDAVVVAGSGVVVSLALTVFYNDIL